MIFHICDNIMNKIDLKDRKILYQLDINSRQSNSLIAKKVGLSKKIVSYRIKRLQKIGVIKNFYTVIDSSKLGYLSFRFYLVLQNTNPEIEQEIINYFINHKNTWWITRVEGRRFDIVVLIWVKDINNFYKFWDNTLLKYKKYFAEQIFSIYAQMALYRFSFLLDDYSKADRKKFEITGGGKEVDYNKLDYQILTLLASDARIPTTELSKKLNISTITIKNRIKKLMKIGVIQGFRINIDSFKLGYLYYKVDIELNDYQKINQIIDFIRDNPHLASIEKSAGFADLELRFYVKNLDELKQIMKNLSDKFPQVIKNYNYFYTSEIHKIQFIPKE